MTTRRKGASRGVDLRWTGKEQDIKRAIGWVQQHNMAALDAIEAAAKREGGDLSRVSVRGGEVYAGSKRLGSVRSFYEAADRR